MISPAAAEPLTIPALPPRPRLAPSFPAILALSPDPGAASTAQDPDPIRKNERQDRRSTDPAHPLDPTSAAVAELASPGIPKATVAQARADQTSIAPRSPLTQAGQAASSPRPASAAPPAAASAPNPQASTNPGPASQTAANTSPTDQPKSESPSNTPQDQQNAARQSQSSAAPAAASPLTTPSPQNEAAAKAGATSIAAKPTSSGTTSSAARALGMAEKALQTQSRRPAPPAQPKAAHEPDDEKFQALLHKGLAAALRQGGGSVTLRLHPEALGDLKIKLDLEGPKLAASFEVGNKQARELLNKNMDTLRSALEARGLDVDRLVVRDAERTGHAGGQGQAPHDPGPFGHPGGAGQQGGGPEHHARQWAGMESPASSAAALDSARMPDEPLAGMQTGAHGEGPLAQESTESGGARVWIRLDAVA